MSGPKYSDFSIEKERQRQLELERQRRLEEERKKNRLQQSIQQEEGKITNQAEKFSERLENLLGEAKLHHLEERFIFSQLTMQQEHINEEVEKILKKYDKEKIPEMESYLKSLKNVQSQFQNEHQNKINELSNQLAEELKLQNDHEHHQQLLSNLSKIEVTKKQTFDLSSITQSDKTDSSESKMNDHINMQNLVNRVYEQVEPYLVNEYTYFYKEVKQLYDSIGSIRNNEKYDHDYKIRQIEMRLKTFLTSKSEYDNVLRNFAKEREEYQNLLIEYQSLCTLLQEEDNPVFQTLELQYKNMLKEEIERLNNKYVEKQEAEYIAKSVHEVMEKLGYDILATDYMVKKKQNIHHHIYEFGFEQAVNVFVSDNGSILFEVSGIGEENTEMTSLQKLKVTEAMEAFCTHYEEIKEELKEKGIHLNNENLSPADEKYARKIDISNKNIVKNRAEKSRRNKGNQTPKTFN